MEYFIIEEGKFWNSILDILKVKAEHGGEVRVLYDDIGCMCTLPEDYHKILRSYGIQATPFARLKGVADSEFNNRTVYSRFCKWRDDGTLYRIFRKLNAKAELKELSIDSTSIKAHPQSAGAKKGL